MAARNSLPVEYLRQCVREENGRIYWLERPRSHFPTIGTFKHWNSLCANKEAGGICKYHSGSRWAVTLDNKHIRRSAIIWVLYNGFWPPDGMEIDHKNRNKLDDRIDNLRLATSQQNKANTSKRRDNTSGYKGVSWDRARSKWYATIVISGRNKHLGFFDDPIGAHAAYMKAAKLTHGEFACDGENPTS